LTAWGFTTTRVLSWPTTHLPTWREGREGVGNKGEEGGVTRGGGWVGAVHGGVQQALASGPQHGARGKGEGEVGWGGGGGECCNNFGSTVCSVCQKATHRAAGMWLVCCLV
jgi:hypothetical protein